jgi:hypothetical protein
VSDNPVPIWLLDVDGVVNAVTNHGPLEAGRLYAAWPKESWIFTEADSGTRVWPIRTATPVVEYIRKVHESGLAEIRWHTTWQDKALNVGRAVGLPDFPIQEAPEYDPAFWQRMRGTDSWWKLPAARRLIQLEERALIWTDDDIYYEMSRQQRQWLRGEGLGRVLLIAPDAYAGLHRKDLDRIDKFLSPGEPEVDNGP